MQHDLVIETLPSSPLLLQELRDGTVSAADPDYGSLNGIQFPIFRFIESSGDDHGYFAIDVDLNWTEISLDTGGTKEVSSTLGGLTFATDAKVESGATSSVSTTSQSDVVVGDEFAFGYVEEMRDIAYVSSPYAFGAVDRESLLKFSTDPHSVSVSTKPDLKGDAVFGVGIKDVEANHYDDGDFAFDVKSAMPIIEFSDPKPYSAINIPSEKWYEDEPSAIAVGATSETWTSSAYGSNIVQQKDPDFFIYDGDPIPGLMIVSSKAHVSDDEVAFSFASTDRSLTIVAIPSAYNMAPETALFLSVNTAKAYGIVDENNPTYVSADLHKAFSLAKISSGFFVDGYSSLSFTNNEIEFYMSVESALSFGLNEPLFHDDVYGVAIYKPSVPKYFGENAFGVGFESKIPKWHLSTAWALSKIDYSNLFFDDNLGAFILDGLSVDGFSDFDLIRWQIIDHLGTNDWKWAVEWPQIQGEQGGIVTRLIQRYIDSVFEPSRFCETIKDVNGRIEQITFFTDEAWNWPRYKIEFVYTDSTSLDLATSKTTHYHLAGVATNVIDEIYGQDANGDTISLSYTSTELTVPPISNTYTGTDTPGVGDNVLSPDQFRVWVDTRNAIPTTWFVVRNPAGVYGAVESSKFATA